MASCKCLFVLFVALFPLLFAMRWVAGYPMRRFLSFQTLEELLQIC